MTGSKLKVLTIDDEDLIRESLRAFLEDLDYQVVEAANGEEGLAVFRREKPDVILSDLNMPVLDGLGVLAQVKAESPETPFIVISGAGDIKYAVEALRLGAWDYLIKPIVELTALQHAIQRSTERVRLLAENERYKKELEAANEELAESLSILKTDQEAGLRVQTGLLPASHQEGDGFTFDLIYLPALYLSGDFVDYLTLGEDQSCFYLADVSGHGVSSAFGTVLLKSLMDQFYTDFFCQQNSLVTDPAKLLKALGESFRKVQLGKYLTMLYGVIDRRQKTLTYSIGGQFPNPILADEEGVRYLEGKGFPIGVYAGAVYENRTIPLRFPFSLFCLSDGVLELFQDLELAGKEKRLLELCHGVDVSIKQVGEALQLSQLKKRLDDITILQIRGQAK